MSRGLGICMRRVLTLLKEAPERRLSRVELEQELVEREGYRSDNVLRSVRALRGRYLISFTERRFKASSFAALPAEVEPMSDEEVFRLLKGLRA